MPLIIKLYRSMTGKYRIAELADGRLEAAETDALKASLQNVPADARCMFIRHLLAAVGAQMTEYGRRRRYLSRRQEVLEQYRSRQGDGQDAEDFLRQRAHALKVRKENGLLKPGEEGLERRVDDSLREILYGPGDDSDIRKETENLKRQKEEILKNLNRLTDFVRDAFGEDLELAEWLRGIENHGDAHALGFSRPEYAVLLDRKGQEAALKEKIKTWRNNMKLLIASDIHGSAYYCRKLLEAYKKEEADKLILLGDILYHGPRNDLPEEYAPKEVIAMLNPMKQEILCVRGNCDTEVDQMVLEFPIWRIMVSCTKGDA